MEGVDSPSPTLSISDSGLDAKSDWIFGFKKNIIVLSDPPRLLFDLKANTTFHPTCRMKCRTCRMKCRTCRMKCRTCRMKCWTCRMKCWTCWMEWCRLFHRPSNISYNILPHFTTVLTFRVGWDVRRLAIISPHLLGWLLFFDKDVARNTHLYYLLFICCV